MMFGHSHQKFDQVIDGVRFINPATPANPSLARTAAWRSWKYPREKVGRALRDTHRHAVTTDSHFKGWAGASSAGLASGVVVEPHETLDAISGHFPFIPTPRRSSFLDR